MWNDKLGLHDGSYSVSYMKDYFQCILKKHGEKTDDLSIIIYVNKIKQGITF